MDGLSATRRILSDHVADAAVIILTTFDLDEYVYAALRAGASGFLLKDTPPADLLAGVRLVAAGEALLSPGITRHLIESFSPAANRGPSSPTHPAWTSSPTASAMFSPWSPRDYPTPKSAAGSTSALPTVKTHVARILTKLDARNRAQLIVIAYESRLGSGPAKPERPQQSSDTAT